MLEIRKVARRTKSCSKSEKLLKSCRATSGQPYSGLIIRLECTESRKTLEQKFIFQIGTLILTVSTKSFHSTNLFCCFSRYLAPTNSIAPSFCTYKPHTTHNSSIRCEERANARNVSFRTSLLLPIYIINSVDKTKLCYKLGLNYVGESSRKFSVKQCPGGLVDGVMS